MRKKVDDYIRQATMMHLAKTNVYQKYTKNNSSLDMVSGYVTTEELRQRAIDNMFELVVHNAKTDAEKIEAQGVAVTYRNIEPRLQATGKNEMLFYVNWYVENIDELTDEQTSFLFDFLQRMGYEEGR